MRKQRKDDHLHIVSEINDGPSLNGFQDIHLINDSVPELGMDDINLQTYFLGKKVNYPLVINAITGGIEKGKAINRSLAYIAKKYGLAMAVGSQTIAIDDPAEIESFSIVREVNPDGVIIANVSAGTPVENVLQAIDMIHADGVQLHFNIPQELTMPEGDRTFEKVINNIRNIVEISPVPVIAKEVGFGFSREAVQKLFNAGVKVFDTGGKGGTNFVVIEDKRQGMFGGELDDWGITTAVSLAEIVSLQLPVQIIASGGIRKAIDVAKSLAMGAEMAAIAAPYLRVLLKDGIDGLDNEVSNFLYRLKAVFLMTGSRNCDEIKNKSVIILGDTAGWLLARGIDPYRWSRK